MLPRLSTGRSSKKAGTPVKRRLKTRIPVVPQPIVEVEKWSEFDAKELKLKLAFPKQPTITVNSFTEVDVEVKSSIVRAYVNQVYYMVEVREYPPE